MRSFGDARSIAHPLDESLLRFIARWACDAQFETAERSGLDPALRHVESIAEERHSQFAHIATVALLHRLQIGE